MELGLSKGQRRRDLAGVSASWDSQSHKHCRGLCTDIAIEWEVRALAMQVAEACKKAGAADVDVLPIDMKSSQSIDKLAKTLLEKHKCIDVLVNSAGIFPLSGQTPL